MLILASRILHVIQPNTVNPQTRNWAAEVLTVFGVLGLYGFRVRVFGGSGVVADRSLQPLKLKTPMHKSP